MSLSMCAVFFNLKRIRCDAIRETDEFIRNFVQSSELKPKFTHLVKD